MKFAYIYIYSVTKIFLSNKEPDDKDWAMVEAGHLRIVRPEERDCSQSTCTWDELPILEKAIEELSSSDWKHTIKCDDYYCYCLDLNDPDPVCECGRPGWACCCNNNETP